MIVLSIDNLHANSPKGVEILKGLTTQFESGKLYAVMGPNGSGKSTLASVLAGHPHFSVTSGSVSCFGGDLISKSPEERARLGVFLAFQYPVSVPGVTIGSLLKQSIRAGSNESMKPMEVNQRIDQALSVLGIDRSFLERYVNDNMSGGEKKKSEILQLYCLKPRIAILDETDSGLDVDALKVVSHGVLEARTQNPDMTVVVITHYQRILQYLTPDVVHILMGGQLIKTGGKELAEEVEKSGYAGIMNHVV